MPADNFFTIYGLHVYTLVYIMCVWIHALWVYMYVQHMWGPDYTLDVILHVSSILVFISRQGLSLA